MTMTNVLCQKLNNVSVGKRKLKEAESVLSTMPVDEFEEKLDHKVTKDEKAGCLDEYAQSMVRTLRLPSAHRGRSGESSTGTEADEVPRI